MLLQEYLGNNEQICNLVDYIYAETINELDVEYTGSHYIDTYWYRVCVYEDDLEQCELVSYRLDKEKRILYVDLIANKYVMDTDELEEIFQQKIWTDDETWGESDYRAMLATLEAGKEIWW